MAPVVREGRIARRPEGSSRGQETGRRRWQGEAAHHERLAAELIGPGAAAPPILLAGACYVRCMKEPSSCARAQSLPATDVLDG
jgi:hypothetical protein